MNRKEWLWEDFEQLLLHKSYSELNAEEKECAHAFIESESGYADMQMTVKNIKTSFDDELTFLAPPAGLKEKLMAQMDAAPVAESAVNGTGMGKTIAFKPWYRSNVFRLVSAACVLVAVFALGLNYFAGDSKQQVAMQQHEMEKRFETEKPDNIVTPATSSDEKVQQEQNSISDMQAIEELEAPVEDAEKILQDANHAPERSATIDLLLGNPAPGANGNGTNGAAGSSVPGESERKDGYFYGDSPTKSGRSKGLINKRQKAKSESQKKESSPKSLNEISIGSAAESDDTNVHDFNEFERYVEDADSLKFDSLQLQPNLRSADMDSLPE